MSNIKVSVITLTARDVGGLVPVEKALLRQTFKDFEWVVATPTPEIVPKWATALQDPPKPKDLYWQFNRMMNKAIQEAQGELIVSIQDHTGFIPEGLEKFWFYFTHGYDRALVSGVGDKYDDEGVKVWFDPRKRLDQGTFYECFPNDVEMNYCAIPKKAFYEVGGFDEWLDKYAGMDHISVQERMDEMGYKFYLDQTNETFSSVHDRLPDWDKRLALNGPYQQRKAQLKASGDWPVLGYLKEEK